MIIHCDDRGFCLTVTGGLYSAGCYKKLTREQALEHWGSPDYPDTDRGAGFVAAIQRGAELSRLPEGLIDLYLGGGTLPDGTALPTGLLRLYLGGSTLLNGTVLPDDLRVIP